jgi:hypothetical protein
VTTGVDCAGFSSRKGSTGQNRTHEPAPACDRMPVEPSAACGEPE